MEKYAVTDQKALVQAELDEVKKKLNSLDKTAAADEVTRLNQRKHDLEDALTLSDS